MHTLAKLVLKSYMPDQLEVGMYFYTNVGKYLRIVQLDKVPLDEENYVRTNGYPVELYIVDEGNPNIANDTRIYALPHQIGWWDEGDHTDELRDIEVKDLNKIIEEYNGWLEIELDEEDSENIPIPILYEGKVVLREYDDWGDVVEDDDDDEYEYVFKGDEEWDYDNNEPEYDGQGFTHEDNFNYEEDKQIPE